MISESIGLGMKVHNRTGYVMQLLGNDFYFSDASYSFNYIDGMKKSIETDGPKYLNGKQVEFRYSTLTEYLHDTSKLNYTIGRYKGDFFVYTQYKPSAYFDHHWGGYFSSRPMFKWMVRDLLGKERNLNSFFSVLNILNKFSPDSIDSKNFTNAYDELVKVREFNPIMLHHDAITGTHGSTVNNDYKRMIERNHITMDKLTNNLSQSIKSTQKLKDSTTEFLFYNPSFYTRNEIYNVTVKSPNVSFNSYSNLKGELHDNYQLNKDKFSADGTYNLFIEISVPPLGYLSIEVVEHVSELG